MRLEDLKLGYPRLAGLLAAEPGFFVARRFTRLFTRRVLLAQDRLAELEARLDQLDADEQHRVYLASRRHDGSRERAIVTEEIEAALKYYESAIASYRRVAALPSPHLFHVESLKNWLHNNKPLIKEESDFVDAVDDLFALAPQHDTGSLYCGAHKLFRTGYLARVGDWTPCLESQDENVHLRSRERIELIIRIIGTTMVVLVLTVPIIILYLLQNEGARLGVVMFSIVAVAIFLELTLARRVEVFVGTAT
ncbi:hypothetical protein B0T24DRAFT_685157 [Lasiosphaeria ovina]|uniref:DUF6594 domain-containing protein n=1 Tax=Lasiosphaeria ovina TaxID=92902 RepID=A0AAE0MYG4_9PEZI|nr:hypothetical protein B0T24DRAFT_685157 [Lasiosphaeria ovina]